jgi:hypothetical protein
MNIRRHTLDLFLFSHGHFQWHPNNSDSRTFGQHGSRVRHVKLEKVTFDGGSFSLNSIAGRLVVISRDSQLKHRLPLQNGTDSFIALLTVSSTDPRPGKRDTDQGHLYSSHNKPASDVGPAEHLLMQNRTSGSVICILHMYPD